MVVGESLNGKLSSFGQRYWKLSHSYTTINDNIQARIKSRSPLLHNSSASNVLIFVLVSSLCGFKLVTLIPRVGRLCVDPPPSRVPPTTINLHLHPSVSVQNNQTHISALDLLLR